MHIVADNKQTNALNSISVFQSHLKPKIENNTIVKWLLPAAAAPVMVVTLASMTKSHSYNHKQCG